MVNQPHPGLDARSFLDTATGNLSIGFCLDQRGLTFPMIEKVSPKVSIKILEDNGCFGFPDNPAHVVTVQIPNAWGNIRIIPTGQVEFCYFQETHVADSSGCEKSGKSEISLHPFLDFSRSCPYGYRPSLGLPFLFGHLAQA